MVTPVTAPKAEPSTVAAVRVEAVSYCVRPVVPLTVPRSTDKVCGARPEVEVCHGMVIATVPDAGDAPLTLASEPSVLKDSVPSEIGPAALRLAALPE